MATQPLTPPKRTFPDARTLIPWFAPLLAAGVVLLIPAPHALAGKS